MKLHTLVQYGYKPFGHQDWRLKIVSSPHFYVAKKYTLQHTVYVAGFFSYLFIYLFQYTVLVAFYFSYLFIYLFHYCYEMLTMPWYHLLYIGYAYRKSMGVHYRGIMHYVVSNTAIWLVHICHMCMHYQGERYNGLLNSAIFIYK